MPTDVVSAAGALAAQGQDQRVTAIKGDTFQDRSTIVLTPTRNGLIHEAVVSGMLKLVAPLNSPREWMFSAGHEVGVAYDTMIRRVLENPELRQWKWIMSYEDDMIVPPDAQVRLIEAAEAARCDVAGALYFTKGADRVPMAYGDPAKLNPVDFRPLATGCAEAGGTIEVNGLGMGFTLWRLGLFVELPPPWFVTTVESNGDSYSQDLWFCQRARLAGKRLVAALDVRCGHLHVGENRVY